MSGLGCATGRNESIAPLRQEPQLALAANSQDADFISRDHEPVQGNVTRLTIGNDQFAQLALDAPADQWMGGKADDRRADCLDGADRSIRVLVAQDLERTLNVIERSR